MSDFYFGVSDEQALAIIKGFVNRINADFYGNGKEGLMQQVVRFIGDVRATEKERDRQQALRHQENAEKLDEIGEALGNATLNMSKKSLWWTIAGVAAAFASLMVAVAAIALTVYLAKHAQLEPLHIFHTHQVQSALSSFQDSAIPHSVR